MIRQSVIVFLLVASVQVSRSSGQTAIVDIPLDENRPRVASQWGSEALFAVSDPAGSSVGPTGASRAYGILGTAMYDAWSAYEALPASTVLGDTLQQSAAANTSANKQEAITYAAFNVLSELFPSPNLVQSFRDRMTGLGYDPDGASSSAANVGVTMANELMAQRRTMVRIKSMDTPIPAVTRP